jgi:PAS domain S-box-containing protein
MSANIDASEITLSDVLRHAVDGMFVIDRNRHVVLFSEGCESITGTDRASVLGTPCACHDVVDCRDEQGRVLSGPLCPSAGIFEHKIASARQRMSIHHRDGRRVWVETTYSPMYDSGGGVACVVGIMRDITEARDKEQDLRRAAEAGIPPGVGDASILADDASTVAAEHGNQPQGGSNLGPLDRILTAIEGREIISALKRAKGQRTLAARTLGISRSRLYRRMEALGIDPREAGLSPPA